MYAIKRKDKYHYLAKTEGKPLVDDPPPFPSLVPSTVTYWLRGPFIPVLNQHSVYDTKEEAEARIVKRLGETDRVSIIEVIALNAETCIERKEDWKHCGDNDCPTCEAYAKIYKCS